MIRSVDRSPPARPAAIDAVAAVLVFGGLFGLGQLAIGDFVITGSLPAKGPILGVAAVLYVASTVLGVAVRLGRGWLAALNLAVVFALVYLAALGHAVPTVLGFLHAAAALTLWRFRAWFRAMDALRGGQGGASASRYASSHSPGSNSQSRAGSRRKPRDS